MQRTPLRRAPPRTASTAHGGGARNSPASMPTSSLTPTHLGSQHDCLRGPDQISGTAGRFLLGLGQEGVETVLRPARLGLLGADRPLLAIRDDRDAVGRDSL